MNYYRVNDCRNASTRVRINVTFLEKSRRFKINKQSLRLFTAARKYLYLNYTSSYSFSIYSVTHRYRVYREIRRWNQKEKRNREMVNEFEIRKKRKNYSNVLFNFHEKIGIVFKKSNEESVTEN